MKTLCTSALALSLVGFSWSASAGELRLDEAQLDAVTAGFITSSQARALVAQTQSAISGNLGQELVGDSNFTLDDIPALVSGTQGDILAELSNQLGALSAPAAGL